jgi:GNAT superfamily N-acetyltransferase
MKMETKRTNKMMSLNNEYISYSIIPFSSLCILWKLRQCSNQDAVSYDKIEKDDTWTVNEHFNVKNVTLEHISKDDIPKAALVCAKAMISTPSWADIYPIDGADHSWRVKALYKLFSRNFYLMHAKNPKVLKCAYDRSDPHHPRMICFFMFPESTIAYVTLWDKIKYGLLLIPFESGFDATLRLLKASSYFEDQFHHFMGDRSYIELQRMVVHPAYQGKGVGSHCLGNYVQFIKIIIYIVLFVLFFLTKYYFNNEF